ncbi:MAG: hypothetical protein K6360_05575 [Deltaproteobacteria bacterium]
MKPALLLYNLLAAPLAPPLLVRDLFHRPFSRFRERLGFIPQISRPKGQTPRIWIHALSVGEANAAIPFARKCAEKWGRDAVVCTGTTETGITTLESRLSNVVSAVLPAPFDIPLSVRCVTEQIRPDCFILVETDIWPNWIWHLASCGVQTALVNGGISSRSAALITRVRPLAQLLYGGFKHIVMQSQEDRDRLIGIGIPPERVTVLGNLKYDRPLPDLPLDQKIEFALEIGLEPERPVLVAGSTHPGEEEIILKAFLHVRKTVSRLQMLIAPRHPARAGDVFDMVRRSGLCARLRSAKERQGPVDVVILDTLGELFRCYGVCDAAFVGGSLVPVGGHNLVEPAAWGVPVLFGPHVESCREMARGLATSGGGLMVAGVEDLASALERLFIDHTARKIAGKKARGVVEKNQGAIERHITLVETMLRDRRTL